MPPLPGWAPWVVEVVPAELVLPPIVALPAGAPFGLPPAAVELGMPPAFVIPPPCAAPPPRAPALSPVAASPAPPPSLGPLPQARHMDARDKQIVDFVDCIFTRLLYLLSRKDQIWHGSGGLTGGRGGAGLSLLARLLTR